jgi:hypothetical protein
MVMMCVHLHHMLPEVVSAMLVTISPLIASLVNRCTEGYSAIQSLSRMRTLPCALRTREACLLSVAMDGLVSSRGVFWHLSEGAGARLTHRRRVPMAHFRLRLVWMKTIHSACV